MPDQPLRDPAGRAQEHQQPVEIDSDRSRHAFDVAAWFAVGSRQGVAELPTASTASTPSDLEVRVGIVKSSDHISRVHVLTYCDGGSDVLGVVDDLPSEQPTVELQGDECPAGPTGLG